MAEENKTLARRFYDELFNKKNIAVLDEMCDPAFKDRTPMPGTSGDLAATKEMFKTFMGALPDASLTIEELVSEGDTVVAHFTLNATHNGPLFGAPATGKTVAMHGVDIIHLKNGRATDVWHYGDDMAVMASLGVKPPT